MRCQRPVRTWERGPRGHLRSKKPENSAISFWGGWEIFWKMESLNIPEGCVRFPEAQGKPIQTEGVMSRHRRGGGVGEDPRSTDRSVGKEGRGR